MNPDLVTPAAGPPAEPQTPRAPLSIAEVVLAYSLFASAWILFSDTLLAKLVRDPDVLMVASTLKGWVFVAVTAILLYFLMHRLNPRAGTPGATARTPVSERFWRSAPLLVATAGVVAVAVAGATSAFRQELAKDHARLQAMAELKAGQVAAWLVEREADIQFLHSSRHWATLFGRVRTGDRAAMEQLLERMDEYRNHHHYSAVLLLDEQGQLVLASGDPGPGSTPELRAATRIAVVRKSAGASISALADPKQTLRLEFLAPLPVLEGTPAAVVVLVPDLPGALFPLLSDWPSPGEEPSIALAHLEASGARLVPVRGEVDLATVSRAFGTKVGGGVPIAAPGGRILATARVRNTDWAVATAVDRAELTAEARNHATWIGLAASFGLFALLAGAFVHRQRQALRFARLQQDEQAGKLQALSERISAEEALRASNEQKDRLACELERHRDNLEGLVAERTRELGRMISNLETFNYTISHDLRAPLRAINGFAAVLTTTENQRLSPEGGRLLDRIRSCSERMDRLLKDILEYSRVDRAEPLRSPVDLRRLVDEVVRDFAAGYPDTQVVVGDLPTIQADATMMRQVFSNLVGNAFKFSGACAMPRVEIGATYANDSTEVFVRDNGAGFDMRYAGKLFKIFQRVHSDAEFPGTGVGLAIVKRLIEHHGGAVRAESAPGEGATFYFTVAATPPA